MTVQKQLDELIAIRASEWLDVLRDGHPKDRAAFVAWLCEAPRNIDEFLVVAGLEESLRRSQFLATLDVDALVTRISADKSRIVRLPMRASPRERRRLPQRSKVGLAAALGALAVALTVFGVASLSSQRYDTRVGEQRSVELPDGSMMYVNAESSVEIRFSASVRDIRISNGEALFKVAKDPQRPFRVHTPSAVVEAIGTEFNVYARDTRTRVSVLEGRVSVESDQAATARDAQRSVAAPQSAADHATYVSAGEQADVLPAGEIKRAANANIDNAVAWRKRRLVFLQTSLEEMVAEINRHNVSVQIRLVGVAPGSRHYSATFDAQDPRGLAALLSRENDLSVVTANGVITVTYVGSTSGGSSAVQ